MKNLKKLLSSLLVLTLVFCSLSAGMTVLAAEEETATAKTPFASFLVGGRQVDFSKAENCVVSNYAAGTAQIQWTANEGWNIDRVYYLETPKATEKNVNNGDTVKIAKGGSLTLLVNATTEGKSHSFYGSVEIIRAKLALQGKTLWVGEEAYLSWSGLGGFCEIQSIKSQNTEVLAVKKREYGIDYLKPIKPGKAVIVVRLKMNGEVKTFKATYTVKAYPNALKSLKVGGKVVNLKKHKFYAPVKGGKKKFKVEYKAAKGWKVKCTCWDYACAKTVKVKSGGTVSAPKWLVFRLTKGKDVFEYNVNIPE